MGWLEFAKLSGKVNFTSSFKRATQRSLTILTTCQIG